MKSELNWIKDAVATDNKILDHLRFVLVKDGFVHGYDGRVCAAHPFSDTRTYLVPMAHFYAAIDRLSGDDEVRIDIAAEAIVVKQGRLRATIRTLDPVLWAYAPPKDVKWRPVPQDLIEVFTDLRPFLSDNASQPWSLGMQLKNGVLYATNNVVLAAADLPGAGVPEALIPAWAVDFVCKRAIDLTHWALDARALYFKWKNGAWAWAQLINATYPETAYGLIAKLPEPSTEIDVAWIEAYNRVVSLGGDYVKLYPDRIVSQQDGLIAEEPMATPAPANGTDDHSAWAIEQLGNVLSCATHWSPDAFPMPAPFIGPKVRGIIVGRRG